MFLSLPIFCILTKTNTSRMSAINTQTQTQTAPFSVYIPYSRLLSDDQIIDIFDRCQIGKVSHIDRVSRFTSAYQLQALYVHFEQIYDQHNQYVTSLRNGDSRILYYSDTDYWTLWLNNSNKRLPGARKIRIQLDEQEVSTPNKQIAPTLPPVASVNDSLTPVASLIAPTLPKEIPSFNYVSNDYVSALEKKNRYLSYKLVKSKKDIDYKNNQICVLAMKLARIKSITKFDDNVLSEDYLNNINIKNKYTIDSPVTTNKEVDNEIPPVDIDTPDEYFTTEENINADLNIAYV